MRQHFTSNMEPLVYFTVFYNSRLDSAQALIREKYMFYCSQLHFVYSTITLYRVY